MLSTQCRRPPLHRRSTHFSHALASKMRMFSRLAQRPKPETVQRQAVEPHTKEGSTWKPVSSSSSSAPLDYPLVIVQNHTTCCPSTLANTWPTGNKTSTFTHSSRASHHKFRPIYMSHPLAGKAAVREKEPCVPGPRPLTSESTNCHKFGPGFIPEASRHVIMCTHETIARVQCTKRGSGTQEHEGDMTDDNL